MIGGSTRTVVYSTVADGCVSATRIERSCSATVGSSSGEFEQVRGSSRGRGSSFDMLAIFSLLAS